jgi:hypothetical protein
MPGPVEPWKERSPGPLLTEGAGLPSMQVIAGWFDPDE